MAEQIHQHQPVISFGTDLDEAEIAVILLHGRGSSAQAMIPLAQELQHDGINFQIPQAALNRWYPNSAFSPIESNEPDLSSALDTIDLLVKELQDHGFSLDRIVIGGFSQGACLASEYVARNPGRYGGLFVFSGALIGPGEMVRNDQGSLDGTPVFIGGSDIDPWVTLDLMHKTKSVLDNMTASVDFRVYPGMAHTINQDELDAVRSILTEVSSGNSQ